MRRRYRVRIRYREPIFETKNGPRDQAYEWSTTVVAEGPGEADARARASFHDLAERSSVCWVREIESVDLESDPDPGPGRETAT